MTKSGPVSGGGLERSGGHHLFGALTARKPATMVESKPATSGTIARIVYAIDTRINEANNDDQLVMIDSFAMPDNSRTITLGRPVSPEAHFRLDKRLRDGGMHMELYPDPDQWRSIGKVTEYTEDRTYAMRGRFTPSGPVTVDHEYEIHQRGEGPIAEKTITVTSQAKDWTKDHGHAAEVRALNHEGRTQRLLSEEEARDLLTRIWNLEDLKDPVHLPLRKTIVNFLRRR